MADVNVTVRAWLASGKELSGSMSRDEAEDLQRAVAAQFDEQNPVGSIWLDDHLVRVAAIAALRLESPPRPVATTASPVGGRGVQPRSKASNPTFRAHGLDRGPSTAG